LIGTVIKVNEEKDLALVRVDSLPSHVRPIPLKLDSPPTIGEDAHAVGHPRGEVWSYTRGYVSQYRVKYGWNTGVDDPSHKADVIQTQTPINPGNSGGPLVNSEGELIGLNSFGDPKSPGLNFAVAITSIQNFLKQEGSSRLEKKVKTSSCSKDPIGQKRESTNFGLGTTYFYDPDCKGRSTVTKIVPDKTSEPVLLYFSDPASGDKSILCLVDFDRDGVIDYTLFDADGDGIWDFEGRNKAGEVTASDMKPIKKG